MIIFIIILIVLILLAIVLNENNNKIKNKNPNNQIENKNNIDYSKFITNRYVMTENELKFYRELKKVTDKLQLTIFPQVDLERIINVKDNNRSSRSRIKSRSIDYTIVENTKCKIVCCIELDDSTHNRENVKKVDEFKNNLFKKVGIPLFRIKVKNYYNSEEIENIIKSTKQN